jgi:predicted DNA-binding WGR domain protein
VRRWESAGGGSAAFWEASVEGTTVTVRYGRLGARGRTRSRELASPEAARQHLERAIAEKERKGYREVAAGGTARAAKAQPAADEAGTVAGEAGAGAGAAARGAGTAGAVAEEVLPVVLPDEETFRMPAAWRRLVHPRRGGIERSVPPLHPEAEELAARRLTEEADWVEAVLTSPKSHPRLVEATRAHLNGRHDPLGAAVVAHLTFHYRHPDGAYVDAWVRAHGTAFAARAVLEYFGVELHYNQYGARREDPRLGVVAGNSADAPWGRHKFADRMRALLSVADEDTYRETVTALARCRTDVRRRFLVSYLLPGEQRWVEECCTELSAADGHLRAMLLCSLGSPRQLAHFGRSAGLGWNGWTPALVATLAEGTGKAFAPLLEESLDQAYNTDLIRTYAGFLVELPTDEAFRILLDRTTDKRVRPHLLEAMRRYPVRALRLLGAAATGSGPNASMAGQLLASHVLAHGGLTAAVLPDLPAEVAGLVVPFVTRTGREPDAPAEALPPLLVSPPWAAPRTPRRTRVAAAPPAAPEPQVVWRPGEQEAWSKSRPGYAGWRGTRDWSREIEHLRRTGTLRSHWHIRLFVEAPEEVVRPLLAGCAPEDYWDGEALLKPVAARHGTAALPLLRRAAARHPGTLGGLLLPYRSVEVAGLVCDWLVRLRSADATARAWLARHGPDAVPVLVPHAAGPAGTVRRGAEKALRLLADAHGGEAVREAAAECGAQAAGIVEETLSVDPLVGTLPARLPGIGAWADPALLPQILLTGGGALPADATRNALMLLALSKPGEVYPGLQTLTAHCTAGSLADFAWGLFEQWRLAGMPPKDSWALHALGWLGDDDTVRRLTPVLRAWPGEGAHHRAVEGLTVLAAIGTDVALRHLHGIAQRVPFKALKLRAQERIAEVAEGLGLTGEQLGDRLVPDLGLDADGGTVIDYGPRQFTVGFDEQLRPSVRDADGRQRKALPAPGAKDDPELAPAERKRFAALKKDVRAVAADQVRRLEAAMVTQRTWTAAEFRELFVAHPLTGHLVRRLVWLRDGADGTTTAFRVAQDRTFADVRDAGLALPDEATVRLAHPLHLAAADLAAWSGLFARHEILQPFPQLGRPVHAFTEEEAGGHRLTRFEGATVPVGKLLGLTRRGWERGEPQDAGVERWFHRRVGHDRHVVIGLHEGIAVGAVDVFPDQTFETVWIDSAPGDYWSGRTYPLRFGDLDPITASEILTDLTEVTA